MARKHTRKERDRVWKRTIRWMRATKHTRRKEIEPKNTLKRKEIEPKNVISKWWGLENTLKMKEIEPESALSKWWGLKSTFIGKI